MRWSDYLLTKKGFFNLRIHEQRVWRKAVATIIAPWMKEQPNAFKIWPLEGDNELNKMYEADGKIASEKGMQRLMHFRKTSKLKNLKVSPESMAILKRFKQLEQQQKPKEN